jgi:hypothetical protein
MAFEFNGTSSYIETASTPVTAAPLTMACWFRANTVAGTQSIMYMGNPASAHRFELTRESNFLRLTVAAAAVPATINTSVTINASDWNHVTAVCVSPTSRFIYLNGGDKRPNTTSRTPVGVNSIIIGSQVVSSTRQFFFNGSVAVAGIWNEALTDDEVLSLSKGFAPSLIRPSNLKFYNRCIQKSQDLYGGRALTEVNITKTDHPRIYG